MDSNSCQFEFQTELASKASPRFVSIVVFVNDVG